MEEPLAGSAPPATVVEDADLTDTAPLSGVPGAALPTNVPLAAKPVKARVVPVPYSDQALLRHIFRFVHGLPGDANLDAVARAAAKALKEASELGGDAVPEYLVAPAAASAAAPIASSDTPSWPHPLASIPSKASVTIGSVRATVKAHCVCERVSLLIQAPGMSVVCWGLRGCHTSRISPAFCRAVIVADLGKALGRQARVARRRRRGAAASGSFRPPAPEPAQGCSG